MALNPGINVPIASTGLPVPVSIIGLFRRWQPNPKYFLFRNVLPEKAYATTIMGYDVMHSPTGRLKVGNEDSTPTAVHGMRKMDRVFLKPTYYDRLQELRPSDFLESVMPGTIDQINPEYLASLNMEEIALAIEVEQEINRIGALSGTVQPTLFGTNDTPYSYPVQTLNTTNDTSANTAGAKNAGGKPWTDPTSDPIGDLKFGRKMLRGLAFDPTLYINLTGQDLLSQHPEIVNLAKQSVLAGDLSPGVFAEDGRTITNSGLQSLLKQFTGIENIICYDEGWKDESEAFNVFIPDGIALLIGKPFGGQELGHVGACKVIHNGSVLAPQGGRFLTIFDKTRTEINGPYQMYGGYKGAVALPFPEAIVRFTYN